ncbi:hypothetical protein FKM82_025493 [Ascaphus truei]
MCVCVVSLQEREEAARMFKGKRGAQLAKDIAKRSKTFTPGAGLPTERKRLGPSPGDVEAIKVKSWISLCHHLLGVAVCVCQGGIVCVYVGHVGKVHLAHTSGVRESAVTVLFVAP